MLHPARLVLLELITIVAFGVAEKPLRNKLGACAGAMVVAAIVAVGGASTLGTHSENCDPDSGCDEVVDFIPSDAERAQSGLNQFFLFAPPGEVGIVIGAWPDLTGRRRVTQPSPENIEGSP